MTISIPIWILLSCTDPQNENKYMIWHYHVIFKLQLRWL